MLHISVTHSHSNEQFENVLYVAVMAFSRNCCASFIKSELSTHPFGASQNFQTVKFQVEQKIKDAEYLISLHAVMLL